MKKNINKLEQCAIELFNHVRKRKELFNSLPLECRGSQLGKIYDNTTMKLEQDYHKLLGFIEELKLTIK